jgi:hypothetical protein
VKVRDDDMDPSRRGAALCDRLHGKYGSLAPSLTLLFHLADTPRGGPVGKPSLLRALAWCDYRPRTHPQLTKTHV